MKSSAVAARCDGKPECEPAMQAPPSSFTALISALLTQGAGRPVPEEHDCDDIGYEAATPCLQAALWQEMTLGASAERR